MKPLHVFYLVPLLLLITACPVVYDYPLGEPDKEKFDAALSGTWLNTSDTSIPKKIEIIKVTDGKALLRILDSGMETDIFEYNAWCTTVCKHTFVYYTYEDGGYSCFEYHIYSNDKIAFNEIQLLSSGYAGTSTDELRIEVCASLQNIDWGNNKMYFEKTH